MFKGKHYQKEIILLMVNLYSHIYSEVEVEAANKIETGIFKSSTI